MKKLKKIWLYVTERAETPGKRTVLVWGGAAAAVALTYVDQGPGPALGVLVATVQSIAGR